MAKRTNTRITLASTSSGVLTPKLNLKADTQATDAPIGRAAANDDAVSLARCHCADQADKRIATLSLGDFMKFSVSAVPAYTRLLGYLSGFRGAFLHGILGGILFAAAQSSFLWFLKVFLDGAFFERDPQVLSWVPPGVVILFLLRGLRDFSQTYFMTKVARGIVKRIRSQLFERLMLLPVSHYDSTASGPLISRVVFNSEMVAQASTDSIVSLVRESLIIVGSLVYLFTVNVQLTLVALIVVPPIAVLIRSINRHFRRYGIKIQSSLGEVTRVVKDAVEAPKAIRIYNAQAFETRQFEAINEENRRLALKLGLMKGLSNPAVQVIASLALAAILFIAIREWTSGRHVELCAIGSPHRSNVPFTGTLLRPA